MTCNLKPSIASFPRKELLARKRFGLILSRILESALISALETPNNLLAFDDSGGSRGRGFRERVKKDIPIYH